MTPTPQDPRSHPASRPRNAWRSAGIAALGLVGGVLLALIVQDILTTVLVHDGAIPTGLAVVLGLLMPVLAILGALIAVLIHNRTTKWTACRFSDTPKHLVSGHLT